MSTVAATTGVPLETPALYAMYLGFLLCALVAAMCYKGYQKAPATSGPAFLSFQRQFLFVYLLMMAADWMQGPYVYKLYSFYGFSRHDNGVLFIAGFGSSLVFGTWAGPLADKYGRKLSCAIYGISYALCCCTKHFNNYWILMVGRLLGGFSTSILWSAFESWMVSEHNSRGFDPMLVGSTFSLMIAFNGIVAIGSGLVAQVAYNTFEHPVAPFDVSAILLIFGTFVVWTSWTENYGETQSALGTKMIDALKTIKSDPKIIFVGLQQALFEGAMYTFVFMWTPTLEVEGGPPIPHGNIFASFMIACSLGGTLFSFSEARITTQRLTIYLYAVSACMMFVPVITSDATLIMGSFIVFEIMVGLFWPAIGTLRSRYLPEHSRATLMNLFRVPLNFMVCIVLYYQGGLAVSTVFKICAVFHVFALLCGILLVHYIPSDPLKSTDSESEKEKTIEPGE